MNRQQENSIRMLLFSSLLGKTTQAHVTPAIQRTNQQQHLQTYSYQLTSKLPAISSSNNFNLTKRGDGQIGKYRGKLRTTHFRPYVTTVESACHGIFSKAYQEPANVDWESICIVRSAATSAVSQWQTRLTETTTSTECNFGMAEIYKHVILSINRVVSSYDYVKCEVVLYCRRVYDLVGNVRNSSHPLDQRSHTPKGFDGFVRLPALDFCWVYETHAQFS